MKIIYEDNHIIAAVKPAGVLAQGDKTRDTSMVDEVKQYIKEKYKKPGNVFLGVLHRLDRPASGIMLFAKTSKGAARLSEQFRNKIVKKTYHALVSGPGTSLHLAVRPKGTLENKLGKDERLHKAKEYADGEKVQLEYEVVKSSGKYSLLQIKIDTGKFHQIRAQLALAGMPIVGDVKYKGEKWSDEKSIGLCATGLSFQAATEDKKVEVHIGAPAEWQKYLSVIPTLRSE